MSIECNKSIFSRSRGAPCGALLGKMKLMMEGQNRSINRTHGSTLVIFLVCEYILQDLVYENSRLHKSIMRKMRVNIGIAQFAPHRILDSVITFG